MANDEPMGETGGGTATQGSSGWSTYNVLYLPSGYWINWRAPRDSSALSFTEGFHTGTRALHVLNLIWFGWIARLSPWGKGENFSSFKWFLPAFPRVVGGGGSAPSAFTWDCDCEHWLQDSRELCIEQTVTELVKSWRVPTSRSRVHERTISLRFLGIILERVLRLEVSI